MHEDPEPSADPSRPKAGIGPLIEGHRYDGIREFDNPMPGWWVWIFVASVLFAIVYSVGLHVFDFIDSYEDDLDESLARLEATRATYAERVPAPESDPAALAAIVQDPASVATAATTYASYCAACHGPEGQGLIGPNLSDEYWMHGGTDESIYEVVTSGVADKGMPAWEQVLSFEDRARLVALIRSFAGTDPPAAKEPQGERLN